MTSLRVRSFSHFFNISVIKLNIGVIVHSFSEVSCQGRNCIILFLKDQYFYLTEEVRFSCLPQFLNEKISYFVSKFYKNALIAAVRNYIKQ